MNPFKKIMEINSRLAEISTKAATKEVARLKEEKSRIERIICSNPGLIVVS